LSDKILKGSTMETNTRNMISIFIAILIVIFAVLSIVYSNLKLFNILMLIVLSAQNFIYWSINKNISNKKMAILQLCAGVFIGIVALLLLIIRVWDFSHISS
jgi:predicted ferric reductase